MPEYKLGRLRGKFAVTWIDEAGSRRRVTTRTSDPIAAGRFLDTFIQQKEITKPRIWTVGELWGSYQKMLGNRPSATTMDFEWRKLKGRFENLLPSQITEEIVKEHIEARRALGIKDGTIWTELGRLRMVFAWAVKKKYITSAPYIIRPAKPMPKSHYLTRTQMQKLLSASKFPHLRLFMVLAWTTGARSAALLELTWNRVDFDRGVVKLSAVDIGRPTKGRATVPMNGTLRAALQEAKKGALSDYVVEWAGQKVNSIKKGFKAAGVTAGFPWVSPHVLRHSAAVAMAEGGVSMSEIAQFLGHGDSRITECVYARFSPEHLQEAAKSLELSPVA
jgi:integrase